MYPLIYSAGPDKTFSVLSDFATGSLPVVDYSQPQIAATGTNNPTHFPIWINANSNNDQPMGTTYDISAERNAISTWEASGWLDNIHNHLMGTR